MRILRNLGLLTCAVLLAGWPAAGQVMMNLPSVRGVWNPVVGSGSAYELDSAKGKTNVEILVVGKEMVNGNDGFWIEMGLNPNGQGQLYAKSLMSTDGKTASIWRTVIQMGAAPPMELPGNMGRQQPPPADIRQDAQLIGTESVTTPAGTFSCEHYKTKDGDAWLSTKVTPWALVKAVGNDQTITLQKVIGNATDHITGTPQKFDPALLMRQRTGQ